MNELIEKLKPCDSNLFKIATVPSLDEESAKKLINKHIHFTWHNKKDKTVLNIPGLVIDYKDGKLKVFTNDILFEDNSIDEEHNKFIELIPITDIENYMVFDNYTKNCWELSENIDFNDDGIVPKIYKISNIYGETIECIINDIDTLNISFTYKTSNGDIVTISDYPSYFIKSIKLV